MIGMPCSLFDLSNHRIHSPIRFPRPARFVVKLNRMEVLTVPGRYGQDFHAVQLNNEASGSRKTDRAVYPMVRQVKSYRVGEQEGPRI
jgi:hypothetical protein